MTIIERPLDLVPDGSLIGHWLTWSYAGLTAM